ncbi:adenine deaminase 2 [Aspergillus udagawae]|nr:adenine deaminase 2 [Aspergillus udagawae]GFG25129.1 adenine deaminase 2 [Aspergillus udagawae]
MTRFIVFSAVLALAAACNVPEHLRREPPAKTVINNVHVFDGNKFSSPTSLVIVGGLISNAPAAGAYNVVDGAGGYLIPGLIDSHCHITDCSYLTTMRQYGITTALDMGTYPYSALSACKAQGVTDIRGSGAAATVNGTATSHAPGFPTDSFRTIKVFLDTLGPDESTVAAIVTAAHEQNKLVISHATDHAAYAIAEAAGVDIPCHAPLDKPLDASDTAALLLSKSVVVPTLIMMQSVTNNTGAPLSVYNNAAKASVTAMHEASVPILAGSDANASPFVPANPPFGDSLHDELELLVAAGLSPVEALRGATSTAASTFRLHDRGAIRTGLRADLVLLRADPTVDIRNTRAIDKVWVEGVQAEL